MFLRDWTPLDLYERLALENTSSGSGTSVQILAIRAKVLSTSPPRPGVVVHCENSQGENGVQATITAADGEVAITEAADGKASHPLALTLAAGEQQVINLTVDAGSQDVTMELVADLVIAGQRFSKTISSAPLTVHSEAGSSPYSYSWGGQAWMCAVRSTLHGSDSIPEAVQKTCMNGRVFSQAETTPTIASGFAGSWVGHTRSLTITPDGHGHEQIYEGCCTVVVSYDFALDRVDGASLDAAAASGRVTGVDSVTSPGTSPPTGGATVTLNRKGDMITDSLTHASFCLPQTDRCGA